MAFSLDHSLTHLEIKEPDLAELYRSSNSAVPTEEQCRGHLCEAYICCARTDDRLCVYIAFFDTTTQCPVILSTTCDTQKPADQKRIVNEALKLTKSMGFDMEQVKLGYSAAMRQVIIQGINIMRPPRRSAKQQSKTVTPPLETPQHLPDDAPPHDFAAAMANAPSVPEVAPPDLTALSAEVTDLRRALIDMESAKAETEKMAEQTIMAIKLELERTTALYREQEDSGNRLQEQTAVGESGLLAELGSKGVALRALEEMLVRETDLRRETEAKTGELQHRLEREEEESAALRRELDKLHQDVAAERLRSEEQLAGEAARRDAENHAATEREQLLRDELAVARNENSVVQDTLKNVLKEQQVLVNEREALRAELAVLRESAGIARQQERDDLVQEQEGLMNSIKHLEHEQMEARQRYETLLTEKELELKATSAELTSLSASHEYLLGEKKLWDTIADSFKKKAHKAVERLKREKQALEEKLMQMEEAAPRPASLYGQIGAEPSAVAERTVESPFAALGLTDSGAAFAGFSSLGPAMAGGSTIRYAPQVSVISYHSADDIVDLYGSANVVQAAPEGRQRQECSAYVCVLEQGGETAIHLAWHLLDSGEILICLPEKQPEGAGSYARALQDAVFYFESIGFMMDRFELSRNSHRQLKALEKIGICKMATPAEGEKGKETITEDAGVMPAAA